MRTVFHVIGYTQFFGTCRMHLFSDCPQLIKRRRDAHFTWGTRKGTAPDIETVKEYEGDNICKACRKRDTKAK